MGRNYIKVVFWNANMILNKLEELKAYLLEEDIDIALINETHLRPSIRITVPNYNCYRRDRLITKGGGVAVLIKRNLPHEPLPEIKEGRLESVGIQLQTKQGKLNLYAAYIPPGDDLPEEQLNEVFSNSTPTIIAGDFNAKDHEWYSKTNNYRGTKLKNYRDHNKLNIIGPDEDTHFHSQNETADVLDIVISKDIKWKIDLYVQVRLSSDHLPVVMEINLEVEEESRKKAKIDWTKFKQRVIATKHKIRSQMDIERAVQALETSITQALNQATKMLEPNSRIKTIPKFITNMIKEKNKVKKKYYKTLDPGEDKTKHNNKTSSRRTESAPQQ